MSKTTTAPVPPPRPRPRQAKYTEVMFSLDCPWAEEVYLTGDFNGWAAATLPMRRNNRTSRWEKPLALAAGRYEYKFIVDGQWTCDPEAAGNIPNPFGSLNSVKRVA